MVSGYQFIYTLVQLTDKALQARLSIQWYNSVISGYTSHYNNTAVQFTGIRL